MHFLWLVAIPYWFKDGFWSEIGNICPCEVKNNVFLWPNEFES